MSDAQSDQLSFAAATEKISPVWEDYLGILYSITFERLPAIAVRLAERLGVASSAVSNHLHRMERAGLVQFGRRRRIILTEPGYRRAIVVMRRHHLVECWLVDALGIDWADAHHEADRLEHAISPIVEERLMEVMGYPPTCPHGNAIPGYPGHTSSQGFLVDHPIDHTTDGAQVVVERISEEGEYDREFLRLLDAHAIRPGAQIKIESTDLLAGTVTIKSRDLTIILEIRKAANIRVRPIDWARTTTPLRAS